MSDITTESFLSDVSKHQMEIRIENGLYRHLRFSRPDTNNMSFSIVTWPGYLAYTGDMGDFVFARLPDMFDFFRGDKINPGYWAEKVQAACRDGVEEYSEDAARRCITDHIEEQELTDDLKEQIANFPYDDGEHALRQAIDDCNHCLFWDAWEFDFKEYTGRFTWCCHALVWAIRQYDAAASLSQVADAGEGA